MKSPYVTARLAEIDSAIVKTQGSPADPEIASYLARYLVVFTCGVYEDCIEHLFAERGHKTGDTQIRAFVAETMHRSFRNPNLETVKTHIGRFDTSHPTTLLGLLKPENIDAFNSIKTNKDQVAHGQVCAATLRDIADYHSRAKPVLDAIEQVLGL